MSLHQILLQPTDVVFFRDGRPMSGSLAGHTAAWPLPDVTNHALHAALHRAGLSGVHGHDHHKRDGGRVTDARKFGSLLTAGPFPALVGSSRVSRASSGVSLEASPDQPMWFFPRPKDAQLDGSVEVTLRPVRSLTKASNGDPWFNSSLPEPLEYAVANTQPPSKDAGGEQWISPGCFKAYLADEVAKPTNQAGLSGEDYLRDTDLADTEHAIGIGIDPQSQTQDRKNFYSAHYLRLREHFSLGLFAEAMDKDFKHAQHGNDLIKFLLTDHPHSVIVGGQQRLCTAERRDVTVALPLPKGFQTSNDFKKLPNGKVAVKWVLLTPAVWPEIREGTSISGDPIHAHPGGWLPNWVADVDQKFESEDVQAGSVLLLDGPGKEKAKRKKLHQGKRIPARLVAAVVSKPIVVTGWALELAEDQRHEAGDKGGAKSTHLAVPAGAVYYFEADSPEAAAALANALNWHGGDASFKTIKNRRSTLMGEKGYGLGVCGTWDFYENDARCPK